MTFINEKISEEDIEKFELREINRKFGKADLSYYWTIDRLKNVYLREIGYDWQDSKQREISFFWKGYLLSFELRRSGEGVRGGAGRTIWSLPPGIKRIGVPTEIESQYDNVVEDVKLALTAYKDSGFFSSIIDHTAEFLF